MLYDKIENISRYVGLNENLDQAIRYINEVNFSSLDVGTYEIDENRVILFVQDNELLKEDTDQFEYHHFYMDIQLISQGYEKISYGQGELSESIAYDRKSDIGFDHCSQKITYYLDTKNFVAFFPTERHQPNHYAGKGNSVKKYVFKIKFK